MKLNELVELDHFARLVPRLDIDVSKIDDSWHIKFVQAGNGSPHDGGDHRIVTICEVGAFHAAVSRLSIVQDGVFTVGPFYTVAIRSPGDTPDVYIGEAIAFVRAMKLLRGLGYFLHPDALRSDVRPTFVKPRAVKAGLSPSQQRVALDNDPSSGRAPKGY
jgi:hypothetical protein